MNREMHGLEQVAATFTYEWRAHHDGRFESDTLWGRTLEEHWPLFLSCMGVSEQDVKGTVALDAGCGSGAFSRMNADHGAEVVIGVDVSEAVDDAARACEDRPDVHIVQANIFALPLKPAICDLIWCSGVLHHTPDAGRGHRSLSRHLRPGGTLYVKVSPKGFSPFYWTRSILGAIHVTRLPPPALMLLSKAMSYPSAALLWLYRGARRLPGLRPRSAAEAVSVRRRPLREFQLAWFDALSPEHWSRHSEDEVVGWFRREGFDSIVALEVPKIGARGRAPASPDRGGPLTDLSEGRP